MSIEFCRYCNSFGSVKFLSVHYFVFKRRGLKLISVLLFRHGTMGKAQNLDDVNLYPTLQLPKTAQNNVRHNKNNDFDRLPVQGTLLCYSVLKQLNGNCVCDFGFPPGSRREQGSSGLIAASSGTSLPTFRDKPAVPSSWTL